MTYYLIFLPLGPPSTNPVPSSSIHLLLRLRMRKRTNRARIWLFILSNHLSNCSFFSDCQTIFSKHSKERKKEWQLQELDPVHCALDYWATLDPTFCICFLFYRHWINIEAQETLFKYCSLARNKPLCILILLWNDPTSSSSRKYSIPNEERCLSIKYKDN